MRSKFAIPALLAALLAALALARVTAGQGSTQVGVTLTEFKVSITSATVPAGVPVTFTATNHGQMMHEVVLERAGAVDQPFEMKGRETEIEDIAPGQTKSATWTITQPGQYQLACHLPGHYEAGMVERLTVTASPAGAQQAAAPMRLAAPSAENQAEGESQSVGVSMPMPSATPATLPATGSSGSASALWLAAALAGVALATLGAFRVILWQVRIER